MTRSRSKAIEKTMIDPQIVPKQRRQSTIRSSIDSFTGLATTFTNSILFPKQDLSNNRSPNSPTDGVNTLTDWLESCSLDESKCLVNKNCLWPSRETNSRYMRPIISSSPNLIFGSNSFSISQTSPLFVQSTTTSFGQQQAQLWSRFRFAASTIRNNLWIEQIDSPPSNLFASSNNHFSDQSSILTSSPPQIVPSLLTKTSPSSTEEFSSPLLRQRQNTNSEPLIKKEDTQKSSSSKIFFTLTIFAVGLVLGYFLTNTFPPNLIHQWFLIILETCIEISVKYFHLLYGYFQIVMKYFSSFTLG
jgi:hypothetical protein